MQLISLFLLCIPFVGYWSGDSNQKMGNNKFLICYGRLNPLEVKGYDVLILEPEHYTESEILILRNNNNIVAGYISLTEVNNNSKHFDLLSDYIFGKNSTWNSSYIDIKKESAQEILQNLTDDIIDKGFNGLFMDNLDNVSQWGPLKDAEKSLVSIISAIKNNSNDIYLIQNSGFFLNDSLERITDAILVESLFSLYDFKTNEYRFRDKRSLDKMLKRINETSLNSKKDILVLEYANTAKMYIKLERQLKKLELDYFIGKIDLQTIN